MENSVNVQTKEQLIKCCKIIKSTILTLFYFTVRVKNTRQLHSKKKKKIVIVKKNSKRQRERETKK